MNESRHNKSTIGARLRRARQALCLTQQALGEAVESSQRGIQNNEALDRVPGGAVVPKLIEMGINANWLLANKGSMFLEGIAQIRDGVRRIEDGARFDLVTRLFNRYAMKSAVEWLDGVLLENPAYFKGREWDGMPDDQRRPESLLRAYQRSLDAIESYRDEWIRLAFSFDPPLSDKALQEYFPTWIERQVQQSGAEGCLIDQIDC